MRSFGFLGFATWFTGLPALAMMSEAPSNPIPFEPKYLVEIQPGQAYWVTEQGKWELKKQGINFMDITDVGPGVATAEYSARKHPGIGVGRDGQQVIDGDVPKRYLLELAPGETVWVEEEEKWDLKRAGKNFMDITEMPSHEDASILSAATGNIEYPQVTVYNKSLADLSKQLSKANMHENLAKFTSFHTRYYKSDYGKQSANWLYEQIEGIVRDAKADDATVEMFDHPWGQPSIIAKFPGKTNSTVVVAAHQDSINLWLPSILAAPGADDDGSGTVTILEAMRVLLQEDAIVNGEAENTVEFHWYSAEEGGLLGSQAVYRSYKEQGRDVKAMLQQDMTGYIAGTLSAGEEESVGVITDFVDPDLTEFVKRIVTAYCDIPFVLTKCGYACSDHASAGKFGYPSAFVIESDFEYSDKKIHSTDDVLEYLSFDHMLQHAKLTLGFAYELAFANL